MVSESFSIPAAQMIAIVREHGLEGVIAKRLNSLVERQCSAELTRWLEVEDIVQSVFVSFFRRVRQGYYDVPDGDELWNNN